MKKRVYSLEDFRVKKHEGILENGLEVVFIEKPFAPIYGKLIMGAGSVWNPCDNGLAHLTEHLLIGEKVNSTKEDIFGIMESVGGFRNAFTSLEFMSVDAEIADIEHLPQMKEFFAKSLESIYLTPDLLQKEKEIIFSETEKHRSSNSYLQTLELKKILAQKTAWGYSNLGVSELMYETTAEEIENFFQTYCVAQNSKLVIAGGCNFSDIQRNFAGIKMLQGNKAVLPQSPSLITNSIKHFSYYKQPQTTIALAFTGPKSESRESFVLRLAMSCAHDGMTSLFYKNIRSAKGLAYGIATKSLVFNRVKYFGTEIGVPTDKIDDAIDALIETYQVLLTEGISQQEISNKIDTLYFSAKRSNERSVDYVGKFSYLEKQEDEVFGDFPDIYNFWQTVTSDEVVEVLKKYITLENFHLFVFGKEAGKKYF